MYLYGVELAVYAEIFIKLTSLMWRQFYLERSLSV